MNRSMDRLIGTLILLLAATSSCFSQEYREWKSADGEFALEAELYELLEDAVLLKRKENGKVAKVPIDKLSDKDKEFLKSLKDFDWGTWIDNTKKAKQRSVNGKLTLTLPGGMRTKHEQQDKMHSPRLTTKKVDAEDFEVQVTVDGEFDSKKGGKNEYRGAGLYLMTDESSFIRLERACYNGNHYVNFEKRERFGLKRFGSFAESEIDPSKPITLRMIVDSGKVMVGYKQGKDWKYLTRKEEWEPERRDGKLAQTVGVAAISTSRSNFVPSFEDFQLQSPPLASVTGKVMQNGRPLPEALVEFSPETGTPSYGYTDKEGRYELQYSKDRTGALLGQHTISIRTAGEATDPNTGNVVKRPETIPAKFNDESELEVKVEPGMAPIFFKLRGKRNTTQK